MLDKIICSTGQLQERACKIKPAAIPPSKRSLTYTLPITQVVEPLPSIKKQPVKLYRIDDPSCLT